MEKKVIWNKKYRIKFQIEYLEDKKHKGKKDEKCEKIWERADYFREYKTSWF